MSGAHEALARVQEAAGIPVATTNMGKGVVDERHPLSVGVIGYFMGKRGRARHLRGLIDEADAILFVGNRTNQNGTDSWTLFPKGATYIHIDVDGAELGRNYEAVRLRGDVKLTLEALNGALAHEDLSVRRVARARVEQRIAAGRKAYREEAAPMLRSEAVPIRPEQLMGELDAILTADCIFVSDASYSAVWGANFLTSKQPGMRFLAGRGLAGLGWGRRHRREDCSAGARGVLPDG